MQSRLFSGIIRKGKSSTWGGGGGGVRLLNAIAQSLSVLNAVKQVFHKRVLAR